MSRATQSFTEECSNCGDGVDVEVNVHDFDDAQIYEVFRDRGLCDLDTVIEFLERSILNQREFGLLIEAIGEVARSVRKTA